MEMKLKRVIRQELINQHPLPSCNTITNKRHKKPMVNSANDIHLSLKLSLSLSASCFKTLHSDLFTIWKYPLVNIPEPALP